MNKPTIQIGDEVREMTNAEYSQWQTDNDAHSTKIKTLQDAKTAKQLAQQTVLDKLGLTADEAQTLFG